MSDVTMPQIKVYRKWTQWETDGDGDTVGDEPETVKETEESYSCFPDDVDRAEGLSAVDLAVAVLEGKLYVTETSDYPWRVGSWYGACPGDDHSWGMNGAHEDLTAHLEGFTPEEETAIFETVRKHVPSLR